MLEFRDVRGAVQCAIFENISAVRREGAKVAVRFFFRTPINKSISPRERAVSNCAVGTDQL